MGFNLLYTLEPLTKLFPQIAKPRVAVGLNEKIVYTSIALFIYLVCCQVPLYGINRNANPDPLYWTRVILASSRGSLMELGIGPVISAGWLLQFVGLTGIIKADMQSKRDSRIYQGLEKILALMLAFGEIAGQFFIGHHGTFESLGYSGVLLVTVQLLFATFIVILLDDMLESGYGLGSGISLFILANTSENIFWRLFSPITLSSEFGIEFEGSFVSLIHFLLTKPSKLGAIVAAFTRTSAPNLASFGGTVFIFFVVIYLQGIKMYIPLIHQSSRGFQYKYKVRLFYTSNISVILQSMVASKFYELSNILSSRYRGVAFIKLLGNWDGDRCIGGLSYWISPPQEFYQYFSMRGVTYTIFVCLLCAIFAQFWLSVSKSTPKDLAKKFREQELTLQSFRTQSVYTVLDTYVPTAAMLGGIVIGLLTIIGDLLNVIGSSTGILLSVNIIYGYFEKFAGKSRKGEVVKFY